MLMKTLNLYLIFFKLISESDNCNNNGDNNNIMISILLITIIIIIMITMLIAITRMRIIIIVIMITFIITQIKQRKTIICPVNPDWYHHYNLYEGPASHCL